MSDWRFEHVGFENDGLKIAGVEIWKQKWRPTGREPVSLPHPDYRSQIHRYVIYEVGDVRGPVCFAASELSAGAWGFYVPN